MKAIAELDALVSALDKLKGYRARIAQQDEELAALTIR
jgi:hypothetical protein